MESREVNERETKRVLEELRDRELKLAELEHKREADAKVREAKDRERR